MQHNRRLSLFVIFTSFLLSIGSQALADAGMHGVMMVVKGQVEVFQSGSSEATKAKLGLKVYPQDRIVTGKDSRAKVVMLDKNVINISPETDMSIDAYVNDAGTGKKQVDLSVLKGKIRSTVMEKYDGEKNTYKVKTPTAVAGVRGTDFLAGYENGRSQFVTFNGSVQVQPLNAAGLAQRPIFVNASEKVEIDNGKIGPKVSVPPSDILAINKDSAADGQVFNQKEDRVPAQNPSDVNEPSGEAAPASEPAAEPSAPAEGPQDGATTSANPDKGPVADKPSPTERKPASAPSMIRAEDVSADLSGEITLVPGKTPGVAMPGAVRLPTDQTKTPTTDFVREQIRNGRTRVKVNLIDP